MQLNEEVTVAGYICQNPYHKRSGTREVVLLMLATIGNVENYVPVVCWGNTANKVKDRNAGEMVIVNGTYQERKYMHNGETKTVREVSACHISDMV